MFDLPAATVDGQNWMMKALHPAEPSISNVAMPDGTSYDTVPIELTYSKTVGPATLGAIATNWGLDCTLLPHPTCPCVAIPTGGASALTDMVDFRVPMFTGVTFDDDRGVLNGVAQAWRLCGLGVTIHLDANSTKDSGTVAAAQMVVKPDNIAFGGTTVLGRQHCPGVMYDGRDRPTYDQIMALPRAYQSNLRAGMYMPLKLTNTSQHWYSLRESVSLYAPGNVTYGTSAQGWFTVGSPTTVAWPFYHLSPMHNDGTNSMVGGATCAMMGDCFGSFSMTGIDPSSSVVFKVRLLLELKVNALSSLVAHMRPPPLRDDAAISNYYKIIRELPDAYPADYNDSGKILRAISSAISTVAPFLSAVPGFGPLISSAAGPVSALLDFGADRLSNKQSRKRSQKRVNIQKPASGPARNSRKATENFVNALLEQGPVKTTAGRMGVRPRRGGKKNAR